MSLRVVSLHHEAFEGLGFIENWLKEKNADWESVPVYNRTVFPNLENVDWVIVMGGSMSVNDEHLYPWLKCEKDFIAKAISSEKIVLGVCLGAQMIANVLGARVYKNKEREIGWFPVTRAIKSTSHKIAEYFPDTFIPFHWHGETFKLPQGSLHLARSEACENQAFIFEKKVLGLQFHLESTAESVWQLSANCANELVPSRYVDGPYRLRGTPAYFNGAHEILRNLLDYFYGLSSC